MSFHAYVENNPLNANDPSGLETAHLNLSIVISAWFGGGFGGGIVFDDSGNIGIVRTEQRDFNFGIDAELRGSIGSTFENTIFDAYNSTSIQYGGSIDVGPIGFGAEIVANPKPGELFPFVAPDGVEYSVALNSPWDILSPYSLTGSRVESKIVGSVNIFEMMDAAVETAFEFVDQLYPTTPVYSPADGAYTK